MDYLFLFSPRGAFPADTSAAAPDDPYRPPAITTENVPRIDGELAERLLQYQNVRSAAFQGWSPDGHGMLIATRFGDTVQLHRVEKPGSRREQVTFFAEPVSGQFLPGKDDQTLLVSMSQGGDENYQIYRVDRQSGTTTRLTDGTSRNGLGPVQQNGHRMVFSSNRRNGRDTDLYVMDPRRPDSARLILETDGQYFVAADLSLDGKKALVNHYVSINESYPAVLDVESGLRTPIPPLSEDKVAFRNLAFASDGDLAYVSSDARGEFQELARVDLDTFQYTWLTEDLHWDVSAIEVDSTSGRVAFTVNANGASDLYLLTGKDRRRIDLPMGIVSSLEFSPDGKQLGFTLSRPDAPAEAYSIDVATGQPTRWTFSEVGGLNPDTFVAPTQIEFSTFDGRTIPGYLYKPRSASPDRPVPVLISIHGGPESQYRPRFSGTTQFQVNELGLAVLAPNVRRLGRLWKDLPEVG